jgi:hypothetical protein
MSMMNGGYRGKIGEKVADFATIRGRAEAVAADRGGPRPGDRDRRRGVRRWRPSPGDSGTRRRALGRSERHLIGLFLSAIFVLGNPGHPAFIGVMFVGIAIGMLLSLITYSIVRRRRDYASVMQVKADRYEVTVLPDSVGKAPGAGARRHADPRRPAPSATAAEPPQYGSASRSRRATASA